MKAPKGAGAYLAGDSRRDPRTPRVVNVDMGIGKLAAGWHSREALIGLGVVTVTEVWVDAKILEGLRS